MSRPTVTCGSDTVFDYGSESNVTLSATVTPTISESLITWTIMSVPTGSAAMTGTFGDFENGSATGSSPTFATEAGVEGTYVFRCTATNTFGASDINANSHQSIIIKTQATGLYLMNDYQWDWAEYNNNNILTINGYWPTTLAALNSQIGVTLDTTSASRTPGGSAGGDLSGLYPSVQVAAVRGASFELTGITNGQAAVWSDANNRWEPGSAGGASTLLGLTDTPSSLTDAAEYVLAVNDAEDALEATEINAEPRENWPHYRQIWQTGFYMETAPGKSYPLRLKLSDGKFYECDEIKSMSIFDAADIPGGTLGRDASDTNFGVDERRVLHIYAVPDTTAGKFTYIVSEEHPDISGSGPPSYPIYKYVWSCTQLSSSWLLSTVQCGQWCFVKDTTTTHTRSWWTFQGSAEWGSRWGPYTVQSATANSLTYTGNSWTPNIFQGKGMLVSTGPNSFTNGGHEYPYRTVLGNTSNTLWWDPHEPFPVTVSVGETFYVYYNFFAWIPMDGGTSYNGAWGGRDLRSIAPTEICDQAVFTCTGDQDEGHDVDICLGAGERPGWIPGSPLTVDEVSGIQPALSNAGSDFFASIELNRTDGGGHNNSGIHGAEIVPLVSGLCSIYVRTMTGSRDQHIEVGLRGWRNPLWGGKYVV